jgi:hypothetical protein
MLHILYIETAIVVRFYAFLYVIPSNLLQAALYSFGNYHRITALELPGIA